MLEGGGNVGQQTPQTQLQSIIFHWCLFYVVALGRGRSVEIFHSIQESVFLLKLKRHGKHFMSVDVSIQHFTLQHTLHANTSLL